MGVGRAWRRRRGSSGVELIEGRTPESRQVTAVSDLVTPSVVARVQAADGLEGGVAVVEVGTDGLSAILPRDAGLANGSDSKMDWIRQKV